MRAWQLPAALTAGAVWVGVAFAAPPQPPPAASSCSGCHAAQAGVDSAIPRLAGRTAQEIIEHMRAFKSGGRPETVMGRIARGLTDAEVAAIAAWFAQQR